MNMNKYGESSLATNCEMTMGRRKGKSFVKLTVVTLCR